MCALIGPQDNCGSFVENIQRLQDLVQKYVGAVDVQVIHCYRFLLRISFEISPRSLFIG